MSADIKEIYSVYIYRDQLVVAHFEDGTLDQALVLKQPQASSVNEVIQELFDDQPVLQPLSTSETDSYVLDDFSNSKELKDKLGVRNWESLQARVKTAWTVVSFNDGSVSFRRMLKGKGGALLEPPTSTFQSFSNTETKEQITQSIASTVQTELTKK